MPHDQLFKKLLESFLADFLHFVVPHIVPHLDLSRSRVLPTEVFTDIPRGDQRRLDLVVELPRHPAGRPIYLHAEIERDARPGMGDRMWDYSRALALRDRRPLLPVVLYLRGGPPGVEKQVLQAMVVDEPMAAYGYYTFGLSGSDAPAYLDGERPLGWALAALMPTPTDWSRAEHRLRCLQPIARSPDLDEARRFLLLNCVETYLVLSGDDAEEYEMLIDNQQNQDVRQIETTWAERMEARGLERGLERGLLQGRRQGMREIVLRLLEQRFGTLPPPARRKVANLRSDRRLQDLAVRIAEAGSLAELGLD